MKRSKGQNDSTVFNCHVRLICPEHIKCSVIIYSFSECWFNKPENIFKVMVILSQSRVKMDKTSLQWTGPMTGYHALKIWHSCYLQSVRSNPNREGHIFKTEGQNVKITWQCTGSIQDWSALKLWKLSCIVSEYCTREDMDKQTEVKGHDFKDKCQQVKIICSM